MAGKGKGVNRRLIITLILAVVCVAIIGVIVGLFISNGIKDNSEASNCKNSACLRFSAYTQNITNTSVTPCEDFYTFTCGRFSLAYPDRGEHAVFNITTITDPPKYQDMLLKKLPDKLNTPKSAVKKMQMIYRTCLNRFENEYPGGEPLLKMISDIGGWHLLGTWDESKFNINKLLKKVHVDYRTSILFDIFYNELKQSSHYKIQIRRFDQFRRPEGQRLQLLPLLSNVLANDRDKEDSVVDIYKKFMFNITMLLLRDAKVNITDIVKADVNEYVDDVISFSYNLLKNAKAELRFSSTLSVTYLKFPNIINRAPLINWTDLFSSKYPHVVIDKYTLVQAEHLDFLSFVNDIVRDSSKSFLQKYFVWELIAENSIDLSEEYFNENNITSQLLGIATDTMALDKKVYCVYPIVKTHMIHPFRYLYRKTYIEDETVKEVQEMIPTLMEQFLNISLSAEWIKNTLKLEWDASSKVDSINIVGITTPLTSNEEMDSFYASLNVQNLDYLTNRVQLRIYESIDPPETWKIPCHPLYHYFNGLHFEDLLCKDAHFLTESWLIPEQIFQTPFYEYKYPMFIKYANFGFDLARKFVNYFLAAKGGPRSDNQLKCLESNLKKEIINFHHRKEEFSFTPRITEFTDHLGESLAIKLIYDVYKNYTKHTPPEKLPPNIPVNSIDQAFFFALQTALCESRSIEDLFQQASLGMSSKIRWYLAFSQVMAFKEAFNCTYGMHMHPSLWCLTLK